MAGGASLTQFIEFSGLVTCFLVLLLILRELLNTDAEKNSQYRQFVSTLDIVIYPLSFVFLVFLVYKVVEVLSF